MNARKLLCLIVVSLSLLLLRPLCLAQANDGEGPPMAMNGGRMVRGTVTATAPNQLTLKADSGETYQISVSANTQVRKGRDLMKLADVHPGDGVGAMGEIDPANKTVHALFVMVVDAEQVKKAREAMGKTIIAGTVTAIDELRLTIKRTDNVTQIIEVDEGTSFRRGGRGMRMMIEGDPGAAPRTGRASRDATQPGSAPSGTGRAERDRSSAAGESITLADIKPGDAVMGQGSIKNGIFVATQLGVSDPARREGRRRTGDSAPPSSGSVAQPKAAEPR